MTVPPPPFEETHVVARATANAMRAARALIEARAMTWRWRTTQRGLEARGKTPTRSGKRTFGTSIHWDGKKFRTRCTCPMKRTRSCAHRLALMLLFYPILQARSEPTSAYLGLNGKGIPGSGGRSIQTVGKRADPHGWIEGALGPVEDGLDAGFGPAEGPSDGGRTGQPHSGTQIGAFSTSRSQFKPLASLPHLKPRSRPIPAMVFEIHEGAVIGRLEFDYLEGARRVPSTSVEAFTWMKSGETRTLVERNRYHEAVALQRLLGFELTLKGRGQFSTEKLFPETFVHDVAPVLREKGWILEGLEHFAVGLSPPPPVIMDVEIQRRIRWFSFKLSAHAEGVEIPVGEVLAAWRAGHSYVRAGDGRVARVPTEWLEASRDALEALEQLPEDGDQRRTLPPYLAGVAGSLVDTVSATRIAQEFKELRARVGQLEHPTNAPVPAGLCATLRPYQVAGYGWLRNLRALELGGILADDMGLGKTVQVLTLLLAVHEEDSSHRSLVVAPTSVLENWARETARFTPALSTVVHHGTGRRWDERLETAQIVITSYALIRRDLARHLEQDYEYVILDEAQAIKNPDSMTAKACCQLRSRHRLTLTGTPIENRLDELWSQFAFLIPGLLGSRPQFHRRFAMAIEKGESGGTRATLSRRVRPFILRRLKKTVARDLPPLTETNLFCDLSAEETALYKAALAAGRGRIAHAVHRRGLERSKFTVFEVLLKLRQICCHAAISGLDREGAVEGSAKLTLFLETLAEIRTEGHRVLVFSQFVQMLKILASELETAQVPYLYLDGGTKNRQSLVDRFNDGDVPVFLISLKAGGTGLNLTGADYVIHYDPWWNPAVERQATDRAHRIGQTRPVFAYRLIARGTVEERMLELHARKRSLVEGLLAEDGAHAKRLSQEDLAFLMEAESGEEA